MTNPVLHSAVLDKVSRPDVDPLTMSVDERVELVVQTDGLLVDLLAHTHITNHLYLSGCRSLTHLPPGLVVDGDLWLDDCVRLHEFFNTTALGSIYLTDCVSLTSMPERLLVNGNLSLRGCLSLHRLPRQLVVKGNLWLDRCFRLRSVPLMFVVEGKCFARQCRPLLRSELGRLHHHVVFS